MKKILSAIAMAIIASSLLVSGCDTAQRKNVGMVTGGVVGGVAGNAITGGSAAGTIVGAVGGGFVGRQIAQ